LRIFQKQFDCGPGETWWIQTNANVSKNSNQQTGTYVSKQEFTTRVVAPIQNHVVGLAFTAAKITKPWNVQT